MREIDRRRALAGIGAGISAPFVAGRATAATVPGISATEIKIGTTAPYSGPLSGLSVYGDAQTAFFRMINDRGGINGRKVNLLSYDNAFSPPKAVEQTRKLVEDDGVFAIAGFLGTPTNAAVQKYLNDKKVPSLFLTSGAERFNDPKNFPWIVPLYPSYIAQGLIYGRYLVEKKPDAKIAVMYENDDLGKDYLRGLKSGLGALAASMIVKEMPHELSDASIETLVVNARGAGADTFVQFTNSKYAAQGIRKVGSMGWKPLMIIASNAASIGATFVPAGLEYCKGIVTARWEKAATDPAFADDAGVKEFKAFAAKYMPRYNLEDQTAVPGYVCAYSIAHVLRQCGDDLTRENLLKHATSLKDFSVPMLLSDIRLTNTSTDYDAFHAMELVEFTGERFARLSEAIPVASGR